MYDTYDHNISNGTYVNNEDEDVLLSMKRRNAPQVCPRCNNTGWYVGVFEDNFHRAKNVNRVIQEFVKLLYTTPSDDGKYFLTLAGTINIKSEQHVRSLIENIVSQAVIRYNKMLVESIDNGCRVSQSEQIHQAGVSEVAISDDYSSVEAQVTIVTNSGQVSTITLD
jgi:hypothetical protein